MLWHEFDKDYRRKRFVVSSRAAGQERKYCMEPLLKPGLHTDGSDEVKSRFRI